MGLTCRFLRVAGSFHKGNLYSRRKDGDERCLAFLGSGGYFQWRKWDRYKSKGCHPLE